VCSAFSLLRPGPPAVLEDHPECCDRGNILSSVRSTRTCVQLWTNGKSCHFRSGELFHLIRHYLTVDVPSGSDVRMAHQLLLNS
jgi:hypothetical protein